MLKEKPPSKKHLEKKEHVVIVRLRGPHPRYGKSFKTRRIKKKSSGGTRIVKCRNL